MDIIDAIKTRSSTRAFLDKPVDRQIVKQILDAARWAPSDKDTQPWLVAVVTDNTKQQITEKLVQLNADKVAPTPDFPMDKNLPEIYKQRAVVCGMQLYETLHIKREDMEKRGRQWEKNYHFFNAPVGLFFFVDSALGPNAWIDCGMFIQSVMLAALEFGLATCPQRSLSAYPNAVRECLGEKFADKKLITGMSLGYPDKKAPENNYRTERATVSEFTEFFD